VKNILAAVVLLCWASISNATLIDMGKDVLDSRTGLTWLSLDYTVFDFYSDIISGTTTAGSDIFGYRIAKETEVLSLLHDSFGFGDSHLEAREAAHFMHLFGPLACAGSCLSFDTIGGYTETEIDAFFADHPGLHEWASGAYYTSDDGVSGKFHTLGYGIEPIFSSSGTDIVGYSEFGGIDSFGDVDLDTVGGVEVGWFLVKDTPSSVSEPTMAITFLLGLLSLQWFRRKTA